MELSRYTHLFERKGRYFLYASLSNGFAELEREMYDLLLSLPQDQTENSYSQNATKQEFCFDEENLALLRKMKAIDVDDDYELERIRFSHYSRRFNPQTLNLTINPTLACNFRCKYCFEKEHRNEFMNEEIEEKIVKYVKSQTSSSFLNITWFGGEPLLAFETIKRLSAKLIPLKDGYDAGMITNGYLLTPEICRQLGDIKISRIQITVDGNENTHNSRRFLQNGKGTFQQILKNIDAVQTLSPHVRICVRVNVDMENVGEFVDIYNYFKEKNYPNLDVTPGYVVDIDESGTQAFCKMDDAKVRRFMIDMAENHGIYSYDFYPSRRGGICGACKPSSLVIGPKGELYKCWNDVGCADRVFGYIDGNVTNSKVLYQYLGSEDQFAIAKCMECKLLPVCSGGCPYQRIMSKKKGKTFSQCPLMKTNIEEFLWMHYCGKEQKCAKC